MVPANGGNMRVHDVMTADVATARPEATLKDVDADGKVIGVVSEADVLAKSLSEAEDGGRVVGDVMTTPAITIEEYWPVSEAAEQMLKSRVNRLPVVRQQRLVGLVSRADLVRAFARSDAEILSDLREVVALQQEILRDDGRVEISVEHGEVTLAGEVRDRDEAEVITKMVRTVPGVVNVRSELRPAPR